ncbi:D-glutamate deacylase [Ferrimonas gelatinilytica]|uniref:Amidohydrolase family protein n=1 Tax=Ferrimonas gelatinilytica TaxID=1255257 RepID=A0ABP9S8L2_9GAMM
MSKMKWQRLAPKLLAPALWLGLASATAAQDYDLVILNGRVMDPETQFDAQRNVGIKDGRIEVITEEAITGADTIDAEGLVVAPGFIDTHWHGLDALGFKLALRDGVTTAMDLELGALNVDKWYQAREGNQMFNYGTTASHHAVRLLVHDAKEMAEQTVVDLSGPLDVLNMAPLIDEAVKDGVPGHSVTRSSREEVNRITARLDEELRQGALGVGSTVGYMRTGVTTYELFLVQKAAANYGRLSAFHARFYPSAVTPVEHPTGFDEVFSNAFALQAPLLYQHNVDYGWYEIEQKLAAARAAGLNMWSEMYPYMALATFASAEFLQPELYEEGGNKYGSSPDEGGIYDPQLDRFYTKEEFVDVAKNQPSRLVVGFFAYRKPWIIEWIKTPGMTVASDGNYSFKGPQSLDTPFEEYEGHPRIAGTRGTVLRMARENDIPLMDVLANMTYYPAKHLGDAGVASMQVRGRLQEGMVADVTLFDPAKVTDNATFKAKEQGLPTTGIPYVVVNGKVALRDSEIQGVYAGQPIRYPVEEKGRFTPVSEKEWFKQFPPEFQ